MIRASLLTTVLLLGSACNSFAEEGWRTIDGDTIVSPEGQHIRLMGIDTAEKKCRCKEECNLALKATERTRTIINDAHHITLIPIKSDKYGRLLAHVKADGNDVSQILLKEGLAREYHGEKRLSWCTK